MFPIKTKIRTLFRFCTVGAADTLLDFGVFFFLISLNTPSLLAQACSYASGMVNSYVWNRVWTFQVKRKATLQEMFRFILVNLLALWTTIFILYLAQPTSWPLWMSKAFATFIGMMITLLGSRFWVFQESAIQRSEQI